LHRFLYSDTKTDAMGLQIPKESVQSHCIGFCIQPPPLGYFQTFNNSTLNYNLSLP
jgi:hypothetical protein